MKIPTHGGILILLYKAKRDARLLVALLFEWVWLKYVILLVKLRQ